MDTTASKMGVARVKIFILHGWTYNLDRWTHFCELLKADGIEPVRLKVPGLTKPSSKVWTVNEYVDWLHQELANEAKPIVLGHSNGGRIALAYCQKYPDHFKQLILIDSAGIPKNSAKSLKVLAYKVLAKIGKIFTIIPGLKKLFYKIIGRQDYFNAPPNMKQTMHNMLAADKNIDPSQIKIPTTIIWGSEDKSTPLTDGQSLHNQIKGSSWHVINNARHAPFFTHPEKVIDIIKQEAAE